MQYANIDAAATVADYIAGKICITAPLRFGESILDVDNNRLGMLIDDKVYVYGQRPYFYPGATDPQKSSSTLYIIPEGSLDIGDVIFYDTRTNKLVKRMREEIASDNTVLLGEILNLIPIGVIVIPSSLDIYGDGSALMASFRLIERKIPAWLMWEPDLNNDMAYSPAGTDQVKAISGWNPWYGVSSLPQNIQEIKSYGMCWATDWQGAGGNLSSVADCNLDANIINPRFTPDHALSMLPMASETIYAYELSGGAFVDYAYWYDAPIGYPNNYQQINTQNGISGSHMAYIYTPDFCVPSPYNDNYSTAPVGSGVVFPLQEWTKNSNFFTLDPLNSGNLNGLYDFNGYANTKIFEARIGRDNWQWLVQEDTAQVSGLNQPFYNLFARTWEFFTPGTKRGDWHIPSIGEILCIAQFDDYDCRSVNNNGTILQVLSYMYMCEGVIGGPVGSYSAGAGQKVGLMRGAQTWQSIGGSDYIGEFFTSTVAKNADTITGDSVFVSIVPSTGGINVGTTGSSSLKVIPVMRIR